VSKISPFSVIRTHIARWQEDNNKSYFLYKCPYQGLSLFSLTSRNKQNNIIVIQFKVTMTCDLIRIYPRTNGIVCTSLGIILILDMADKIHFINHTGTVVSNIVLKDLSILYADRLFVDKHVSCYNSWTTNKDSTKHLIYGNKKWNGRYIFCLIHTKNIFRKLQNCILIY
jgi:hypothetical protein